MDRRRLGVDHRGRERRGDSEQWVQYIAKQWYAARYPFGLISGWTPTAIAANQTAWNAMVAAGITNHTAHTFDYSCFTAAVETIVGWIDSTVQADGTVGVPNLSYVILSLRYTAFQSADIHDMTRGG